MKAVPVRKPHASCVSGPAEGAPRHRCPASRAAHGSEASVTTVRRRMTTTATRECGSRAAQTPASESARMGQAASANLGQAEPRRRRWTRAESAELVAGRGIARRRHARRPAAGHDHVARSLAGAHRASAGPARPGHPPRQPAGGRRRPRRLPRPDSARSATRACASSARRGRVTRWTRRAPGLQAALSPPWGGGAFGEVIEGGAIARRRAGVVGHDARGRSRARYSPNNAIASHSMICAA